MALTRIMVLMWADVLALYAIWMTMLYLTNVWKLDFTHAAAIINVFWGVSGLLVLPMQYIIDSFLGNFWMLLLSSFSYSAGLGFLTMSTPPVLAKSFDTCRSYAPECIGEGQKILFYTALALIAVGLSGHILSLGGFMAQQLNEQTFDDMFSFCKFFLGTWFTVLVAIGAAFAMTYIKEWSVRYGISAICTVVATLLFLSGTCSYTYVGPSGSLLTIVFKVFVATVVKIFRRIPRDIEQLYEKNDIGGLRGYILPHSRRLRCFDKAAIVLPNKTLDEQANNQWKLCTVTEVEETKLLLRVIPLSLTFIFCGVVSSIANTYFIEQTNHLKHNIGKLSVPILVLLWFYDQGKSIFAQLYFALANCLGGNGARQYAPPIGIAVSMIFGILGCISAAAVERKRLDVVEKHNLVDKPDEKIPMSAFWLIPQFVLIGALDGIFENSVTIFFVDQVGPAMKGYALHFSMAVMGLGNLGSVLSVYLTGKVSERGGKTGWFQSSLNKSRLDKYYWTLAWLTAANLGFYIVMALLYKYRESELEDQEAPEYDETNGPFEDDDAKCCCC